MNETIFFTTTMKKVTSIYYAVDSVWQIQPLGLKCLVFCTCFDWLWFCPTFCLFARFPNLKWVSLFSACVTLLIFYQTKWIDTCPNEFGHFDEQVLFLLTFIWNFIPDLQFNENINTNHFGFGLAGLELHQVCPKSFFNGKLRLFSVFLPSLPSLTLVRTVLLICQANVFLSIVFFNLLIWLSRQFLFPPKTRAVFLRLIFFSFLS